MCQNGLKSVGIIVLGLKTLERQNQGNIRGNGMPEKGFEPSWDYACRWILSPVHLYKINKN
jgi:hypothetical protein